MFFFFLLYHIICILLFFASIITAYNDMTCRGRIRLSLLEMINKKYSQYTLLNLIRYIYYYIFYFVLFCILYIDKQKWWCIVLLIFKAVRIIVPLFFLSMNVIFLLCVCVRKYPRLTIRIKGGKVIDKKAIRSMW